MSYLIGAQEMWGSNLKSLILKLISGIDTLSISCEIALRWMPQDLTHD